MSMEDEKRGGCVVGTGFEMREGDFVCVCG